MASKTFSVIFNDGKFNEIKMMRITTTEGNHLSICQDADEIMVDYDRVEAFLSALNDLLTLNKG